MSEFGMEHIWKSLVFWPKISYGGERTNGDEARFS
ncbi:unnamed protein product [Brassica rapa subsp. narinosa]